MNAKISKGRLASFIETLKNGLPGDYRDHLKKESKENRLIEKYL